MTPDSTPRLHGADDRIRKRLQDLAVPPHLQDWDGACQAFSWEPARHAMGLQAGSPINIGQLALDRHADGPHAAQVALRWLGADGRGQRITYEALRAQCNRFANVLAAAGVRRGDTLFMLLPRWPDLAVAVLGALRAGVVVAPLHPLLGPDPLATRLQMGACRTLLTTAALARNSVAPLRQRLPALAQVLLMGGDGDGTPAGLPAGTVDLEPLLAQGPAQYAAEPTTADTPALLAFTSGATGRPKAVLQGHGAALSLWMTGHHALDLYAGDVAWCTADPGDFGGLGLGLIAPLLHGVTVVVDEAAADPARCCDTLQQQGVTVWATTPMVIRQLMRAGPALLARHRFPRLRLVTSFGAPLDAQAVWWGLDALGLPIHDQWGQTETGTVMVGNTVAQDIKPGAMGRPLPGVQACVVLARDGGKVMVVDTPEAEGELALATGWPGMLQGRPGNDAGTGRQPTDSNTGADAGALRRTGDLVRRDADGYLWFTGRVGDQIRSAGHAVAAHEVEAALASHPAIAEAAVVGKPDPLLGEAVVAYVTLRPGQSASQALRAALLAHALERLGPLAAPRTLEFASQLPHTHDGKLMRRLVRAVVLGQPAHDDPSPV